MIAYIRGLIEEYGDDYVIIDNNGIGYYVSMPVSEIENLKKQKGVVKINTFHYVREDSIDLFGFSEKESLKMFKLLLNVSGVGPKAALAMLSALSPQNITLAIVTGDEKALLKAQGVGKKIAQRIILELKDKFKNYDFLSNDETDIIQSNDSMEAIGALMSLGYTRQEAAFAIRKVDSEGKGIEEIVKLSLKVLMKG
ncbi:MAG: ruvA [Clostridiales bacterium]|jgi:Holliday junction DNA helicase RuvA|nr:ruvA [Clostridiales bacterium]